MWMEVLGWIDSVWSSKECTSSACDPSVHLIVPSIDFVYVVVVCPFQPSSSLIQVLRV